MKRRNKDFKVRIIMKNKINCKMYEEFNMYLHTLGIPSISIKYYDTNYLNIFVEKISEAQVSKEIAKQYSKEIIAYFKKLLKTYNYKGDYNKYEWSSSSVTNVCSQNAIYIDALFRDSKKEVVEKINDKIVPEFRPKYIFVHSSDHDNGYRYLAGYLIIFENEIVLKQSEKNVQSEIIDICNEILIKNDIENKYKPKYLVVGFYDAHNPGLYGMSRED